MPTNLTGKGDPGLFGTVLQGQRANYQVLREVAIGRSTRYYLCCDESGKYYFCAVAQPQDKEIMKNSWIALSEAAEKAQMLREVENGSLLEGSGTLSSLRRTFLENDVKMWRNGRELEGWNPEKAEDDNTQPVCFERYFPRVVERLLHDDLWDNQIKWPVMILEIKQDYDDIVPLKQIIERKYQVDLPTSAWIVGQMLELLVFQRYHDYDISSFLIDPKHRELVYLDWTGSWIGDNPEPYNIFGNIQKAALIGLRLLNVRKDTSGDEVKYVYPQKTTTDENIYLGLLSSMARLDDWYRDKISCMRIWSIHEMFYRTVKQAWPMELHPFKADSIDKQKDV